MLGLRRAKLTRYEISLIEPAHSFIFEDRPGWRIYKDTQGSRPFEKLFWEGAISEHQSR